MRKDARIFVTEPDAMLGRAIVRALVRQDLHKCLLGGSEVDLSQAEQVAAFFKERQPTHVFLVAGKKGGIRANQRFPADLLLDNLRVALNVIEAAFRHGTEKLLYVGSSCMYPRGCPQPMQEQMLQSGPLEPTSEAYAVGKLAGLQLCRAICRQYRRRFVSAIPTNIYGPFDDFDPENAHVVGALIHKIAMAQRERLADVKLWGTGTPRREFIHCDDFGNACVFLMEHYEAAEPINIATGADVSIRELAEQIADILGYQGALRFDATKPDGMPRKSLDGSRLGAMGWMPRVTLAPGLRQTCEWFLQAQDRTGWRARKGRDCLEALPFRAGHWTHDTWQRNNHA